MMRTGVARDRGRSAPIAQRRRRADDASVEAPLRLLETIADEELDSICGSTDDFVAILVRLER
jgi:hypothetical protein